MGFFVFSTFSNVRLIPSSRLVSARPLWWCSNVTIGPPFLKMAAVLVKRCLSGMVSPFNFVIYNNRLQLFWFFHIISGTRTYRVLIRFPDSSSDPVLTDPLKILFLFGLCTVRHLRGKLACIKKNPRIAAGMLAKYVTNFISNTFTICTADMHHLQDHWLWKERIEPLSNTLIHIIFIWFSGRGSS